jgi:hypothetical protein
MVKCGECTYWVRDARFQKPELGQCHRFPPETRGDFIYTEGIQWCGEGRKSDWRDGTTDTPVVIAPAREPQPSTVPDRILEVPPPYPRGKSRRGH